MDSLKNEMAEELAYVRALAEEGRNAPLVSGVYYVAWGLVLAAATTFAWLRSIGVLTVEGLDVTIWVGAFAAGWAISFFLGRRRRAMPGSQTMGNRTANAVWLAVGVFMTSFWFSLMVVHDNFTAYGVPPYFLFSLMFPIAFGAYGVAFYATAAAARLNWMKGFALAAFGFCIVTLFTIATPWHSFSALVGLVVCTITPGIILMRNEPSEIV